MSLPRILITPGEPAGIGADLLCQIAARAHNAELIAVCDPELLRARAQQIGMPLTLRIWAPHRARARTPQGHIDVLPIPLRAQVQAGQLNVENARYVLDTLDAASDLCLRGDADALVTGPVQKSIINDAGIAFSGHTEYLAARCGAVLPVMMLIAERAPRPLRVALATTHLPLHAVPAAISKASICAVLRILDHDLRARFGIARPRILVCGLNPHAGESGHMGREEIDAIAPAIDQLCREGLDLIGPLPADTLFTPQHLDGADAVLSMFHDQGLPVLKYAGFGHAVNVTLGLPIIRTSVDHGTALDLAGSGRAHAGSLQAAIDLAITLAEHAA